MDPRHWTIPLAITCDHFIALENKGYDARIARIPLSASRSRSAASTRYSFRALRNRVSSSRASRFRNIRVATIRGRTRMCVGPPSVVLDGRVPASAREWRELRRTARPNVRLGNFPTRSSNQRRPSTPIQVIRRRALLRAGATHLADGAVRRTRAGTRSGE